MCRFVLCTCDVNCPAPEFAKVLAESAPMLADGAVLLFTIKLPKRHSASYIEICEQHCHEALEAGFERFQTHHLFGNSSHELTLVAWRRPTSQ